MNIYDLNLHIHILIHIHLQIHIHTHTHTHHHQCSDRIVLPVLVELYQWLHIDLAYLVTEEKAAKMTFGSAIAEASKHYYSAAGRKDLNALYQQLKGNSYLFHPARQDRIIALYLCTFVHVHDYEVSLQKSVTRNPIVAFWQHHEQLMSYE